MLRNKFRLQVAVSYSVISVASRKSAQSYCPLNKDIKLKSSLMVPTGVTISLSGSSMLQYGEQGMGILITRLKIFGRLGRLGTV
jgi:hypothetical protein